MSTLADEVLDSLRHRYAALKELGDKTLAQLTDDDVLWSPDPESNSIGIIVTHLHGNMLSRWTEFLTSDGEKPWRDRDGEFAVDQQPSRNEVLRLWEEGWDCVESALRELQPDDLQKQVVIRDQPLSALDAIHRQLSHYAYHVGQIVWIARFRRGDSWNTLSIARGESKLYRPTKRD